MDDSTIERLLSYTKSILDGSDPVLSLMDKRVRDIFKAACTFDLTQAINNKTNCVPQVLRSGIQSKAPAATGVAAKDIFTSVVNEKASKLGFGVAVDEVVEASYDAYKIITHCIKVHDGDVFTPIVNILKSERE